VSELVEAGISVVAAAGNDGQRSLLPPATAPLAITVGGIDDNNSFTDEEIALWHSNYGSASNDVPKPDLVAPSIWVAAPVLPNSSVANEAKDLFIRRKHQDPNVDRRIAKLKLITPYHQHVEGISFAAPIVASAIACMLEANPTLPPLLVRDVKGSSYRSWRRSRTPRRGCVESRTGSGSRFGRKTHQCCKSANLPLRIV
jgi:serine protease AprX